MFLITRKAIGSDLGRVWVLSAWRRPVVVEEGGSSRWFLGSTVGGMKKMVALNSKEEKLRRQKSGNVDY
ncbi:hypothetical protein TIFTF001_010970 [Ficus carica]|uniref:Uncharacterized protein n=1 Tax=Ficus carica TaxID=3494 RepID=A0AA88AD61_FICCA|nr:hypothetical protein TIFTF001_010970 [Ficus carica]